MLKVLLVNDTPRLLGRLQAALRRLGAAEVSEVCAAICIARSIETFKPDIVLVDKDSPSRDVLEQACCTTSATDRQIGLLTADQLPAELKDHMVIYARRSLCEEALQQLMRTLQECFPNHRSKEADPHGGDKEIILRARNLLMQLKAMSASEAQGAMRDMANNRNIPLIDVAHKLIGLNDTFAS